MKSILIVAPSAMYGGGEVYIKNLVQYIKQNTVCRVIVGVCNDRLRSDIAAVADHVFTVRDSASQANKLVNTLIINLQCLHFRPDVVFLNGLPESGLFAFLLATKNVVCVGHSNELHLKQLSGRQGVVASLLKSLFRRSFRKMRLFIAINQLAKNNLESFLPNFNKCAVVYNGVPAIELKLRDSGLRVSRTFTVGRICRLLEDKNVELAMDAVANVSSYTHLVVAGEGPHEEQLRKTAAALDISCSFLGHCAPADFFTQIDVMLLTTPSNSNADATPLVILEAMSVGVPVIATRVGGVPEMIRHMETGILCEDSSSAFAAAIDLLKSNQELRTIIAENARTEYQLRFRPEVTFGQTLALIDQSCHLLD